MANYAPRSLRAASGDCIRFSLGDFERRLSSAIGQPLRELYGKPGGGVPNLSEDPTSALGSYLLSEMMSKFDDGRKNPLKEKTTWEKFHEAEVRCFETNQRLTVQGFSGPYEHAISRARTICSKILGSFSWDLAEGWFGWGPGASTRLPRSKSDAAYKYSGSPESTIGNAILANTAIRRVPSWQRELTDLGEEGLGYVKIVPGNRIVTVPKNYKTDRTIAIEPDMNMYIQKGIGGLMRQRLKRAGCDLDDQTRNQRLARVGAVSGRLATIDLSMASDLISRVLVQKFVRSDWLEALEQSRSPFGVLPSGEKIFYQKFSSMGNGFTFELESVIFYSLALAWCHIHGEEVSRVSVYGDDIVIPSTVASSFCGLLDFVGFKVNEKKSYWSGPFRESCGKHYFLEHEITPFYVRRPVQKLSDLFLLHNNLVRWANRSGRFQVEVESLCRGLRRLAPAKWRKARLPDGYGDGAFICFKDERIDLIPCPNGWEFWVVEVLSPSSEEVDFDGPGLLIKALSRLEIPLEVRCSLDRASIYPSRVGRMKRTRVRLPQYASGTVGN
jgi:hypothetical protein